MVAAIRRASSQVSYLSEVPKPNNLPVFGFAKRSLPHRTDHPLKDFLSTVRPSASARVLARMRGVLCVLLQARDHADGDAV